MRSKKLGAILLAMVLAVAVLLPPAALSISTPAAAAELPARYRYFYDQLGEHSKVIYDGLRAMYEAGALLTGTASYDLADTGHKSHFTQKQIKAYQADQRALVNDLNSARDAFYYDYPDLFYFNYNALGVRIAADAGGTLHAWLGSGRKPNYFNGFTTEADARAAQEKYEAAMSKLVKEAKAAKAAEGEDSDKVAQIRYVHDAIIRQTVYKLDDVCKPANLPFIRTAYGAMVTGEGVCEAYARAFKTAMDRLGIPCVLVAGAYLRNGTDVEAHMWANVQVGKKWYGVDVTMDDDSRLEAKEAVPNDYLLAGSATMNTYHTPNGVMSNPNKEFKYPTLEQNDYGLTEVHNANGLQVRYDPNGVMEGVTSGDFYLSYEGMNSAQARAKGYYFLARFLSVNEDGGWEESSWSYALPETYPALRDIGNELYMPMPHVRYVEFAVTDLAPLTPSVKPEDIHSIEDVLRQLTYQGDPLKLLATSGMLENPSGSYAAPPYIRTASPAMNTRMTIGSTYHITLDFDDTLKLAEGAGKAGITFTSYYYQNGKEVQNDSGVQHSKLAKFHFDGKHTITFDFTPSSMWADDTVFYDFEITGLVGENSGKAPNHAIYLASNPCAAYAFKSEGFDWNVFGKPALMESGDVDMSSWETSDDTDLMQYGEEVRNRLMLAVTTPNGGTESEMKEKIDSKEKGVIEDSTQYYDIQLTLCKKMIVKTGDGVRVTLGFPAGYGPEDAGVTFKAFHFQHDDKGNITGVEEIPCTITPYGLLIICKSFSPFAISAVKGATASQSKSLVLPVTEGGNIGFTQLHNASFQNGILTLEPGGSATMAVHSDADYVLDTLNVAGKDEAFASGAGAANVSIRYDDLDIKEGQAGVVDAQFVAKSVLAAEQELLRNAGAGAKTDLTGQQPTAAPTTAPTAAPTATSGGAAAGGAGRATATPDAGTDAPTTAPTADAGAGSVQAAPTQAPEVTATPTSAPTEKKGGIGALPVVLIVGVVVCGGFVAAAMFMKPRSRRETRSRNRYRKS